METYSEMKQAVEAWVIGKEITMASKKDIEEVKALLDRLSEVDPTPENRQMIAGLIASIKARLEKVL